MAGVKKGLSTFQTYWKIGTLAVGVILALSGAWVWISGVKADASEAKQMATETRKAVEQQAILANKLNDQFWMLLQLAGVSADSIKKWREIPREPIRDTTGRIVQGSEWLEISSDYSTGSIYRYKDTTVVLVKVLWEPKK